MHRASRPSVRPSTTSQKTANTSPIAAQPADGPGELQALIGKLPPALREQAFTHSSWAEQRSSSYERLEFLGDSVLGLAIAEATHERFPEHSEGQLAKLRRSRRESPELCRGRPASRSRRSTGGAWAVVAERGARTALDEPQCHRGRARGCTRCAVHRVRVRVDPQRHRWRVRRLNSSTPSIHTSITRRSFRECLARAGRQVRYAVVSVDGPPHERAFTCAALVDDEEYGLGAGASKKEAEQAAARLALERLQAG